ncbi:uncharacterized protein LOC6573293 [Drosophila mojavensis]|uniref:uncharacterized protein LOC6573293 n=1 Tax=Drosophila mojavensis TaxID=7230 RepID=UPI0013EECE8F|nr:uncharacterized protein LOC6573293 [Drosophila mojavensis]
MRNLWVILTIFTICMQHQFPYNNASTIRLTNFICQSHNESWISVHVCRLKAINRNKIVLNFNATMHNTCYELSTTLQLYKKANGYKPWLYNSSVDICKFTRKPYNPFAIMIYKVMRQYSNMNHTCPYGGPLIITGLHVKYSDLLPFPSGDYLAKLDWYCFKRKQLSTDLYFKSDEGLLKS